MAVILSAIAVVLGVGLWADKNYSAPKSSQASPLILPETLARVTAEQTVKTVMNNPASYRYVSHTAREVQIADGVRGYRVELVFRGTNAFGGVVLDTATVTTDASGANVITVE